LIGVGVAVFFVWRRRSSGSKPKTADVEMSPSPYGQQTYNF
jgi:hypothetical protein